VAARVMSFSQKGPRSVCILSANGTISNVTLRQPGSSGSTFTYEVQTVKLSMVSFSKEREPLILISNHPFSGDSSVLFTFFDLIEIDKSSIKQTKKQTNTVIDSTARKWLPLHTSFYAHWPL
jgi:hypothetical protein